MRQVVNILLLAWLPLCGGSGSPAQTGEPWALRSLTRPVVPKIASDWVKTPVDAFIAAEHHERGLRAAPHAERRALIRRVYFDLIGLPPEPEEVDAFLADGSPDAFAKLVDQLLASPRYGERWARHWMDVVHFAETHGHDEDAIREHAWPYRDYLIRSFNEDKPYARFVLEQVAGDALFPGDPWATVATGLLASGPWDESSQMGIQDGTTDKKIAQYLDRDDMIATVMSTFVSTTAHCARCHDHKFDPVSSADYYALQAVFAGVDRVDRPYEPDPEQARLRATLSGHKTVLARGELPPELRDDPASGDEFRTWVAERREAVAGWSPLADTVARSRDGATPEPLADGSVRFGGHRPEKDSYTISGRVPARIVTAVLLEILTDPAFPQRGPGRADNGNLHLSEIGLSVAGRKLEIARAVADFDQNGWTVAHAIDGNPGTAWGVYPEVGKPHWAIFVLEGPAELEADEELKAVLEQSHGGGHLIGRPRIWVTSVAEPVLPPVFPSAVAAALARDGPADDELLLRAYWHERVARQLAETGEPAKVYAIASRFAAQGNFKPAGKPRAIHVLQRGDIHSPGEPAAPGALSCVAGLPARFELADPGDESARRVALAQWLASPDNVLTWRSIANRVWHYHFGRGIVATPNDFGSMGARPTHPELLDWLAYELRARGGSLKWLHRIICTSAVYQQSTLPHPDAHAADPDNLLLVAAPRRRLDAESIRDAVLQMSGKLDLTMGGPSARQFHASKGVHVTPVLDYLGFDPDDPANFRRGVYRFVFRTVPDPLMAALDCPDASQLAPRREVSITALQALAMLNNHFLVRQCEHLAARLADESSDLRGQVQRLFELAYCRPPSADELAEVSAYAERHGLANACRVVINSSEFVFVN